MALLTAERATIGSNMSTLVLIALLDAKGILLLCCVQLHGDGGCKRGCGGVGHVEARAKGARVQAGRRDVEDRRLVSKGADATRVLACWCAAASGTTAPTKLIAQSQRKAMDEQRSVSYSQL